MIQKSKIGNQTVVFWIYHSFKINLITAACPEDFTPNGGTCHYYSGDRGFFPENYDAAVTLCGNDGGYLARVTTEAENTAIVENLLGATGKRPKGLKIVQTQ